MIVFGPIIIFFSFFGLIILGFLILVFKLLKKSKNDEWKGTVVDKKVITRRDEDGDLKAFYSLIFETETKRTVKIAVNQEVFNQYQIGDKAEKPKGKFFPVKI